MHVRDVQYANICRRLCKCSYDAYVRVHASADSCRYTTVGGKTRLVRCRRWVRPRERVGLLSSSSSSSSSSSAASHAPSAAGAAYAAQMTEAMAAAAAAAASGVGASPPGSLARAASPAAAAGVTVATPAAAAAAAAAGGPPPSYDEASAPSSPSLSTAASFSSSSSVAAKQQQQQQLNSHVVPSVSGGLGSTVGSPVESPVSAGLGTGLPLLSLEEEADWEFEALLEVSAQRLRLLATTTRSRDPPPPRTGLHVQRELLVVFILFNSSAVRNSPGLQKMLFSSLRKCPIDGILLLRSRSPLMFLHTFSAVAPPPSPTPSSSTCLRPLPQVYHACGGQSWARAKGWAIADQANLAGWTGLSLEPRPAAGSAGAGVGDGGEGGGDGGGGAWDPVAAARRLQGDGDDGGNFSGNDGNEGNADGDADDAAAARGLLVTALDLSSNRLVTAPGEAAAAGGGGGAPLAFPECVGEFRCLERLDLSGNQV